MKKKNIEKIFCRLFVFSLILIGGIICSILDISYLLSVIFILLFGIGLFPLSHVIYKKLFICNNKSERVDINNNENVDKKDLSLNIEKKYYNVKNKSKVRVRKKI